MSSKNNLMPFLRYYRNHEGGSTKVSRPGVQGRVELASRAKHPGATITGNQAPTKQASWENGSGRYDPRGEKTWFGVGVGKLPGSCPEGGLISETGLVPWVANPLGDSRDFLKGFMI
jgi:hypothetical protein